MNLDARTLGRSSHGCPGLHSDCKATNVWNGAGSPVTNQVCGVSNFVAHLERKPRVLGCGSKTRPTHSLYLSRSINSGPQVPEPRAQFASPLVRRWLVRHWFAAPPPQVDGWWAARLLVINSQLCPSLLACGPRQFIASSLAPIHSGASLRVNSFKSCKHGD